MVGRPGSWFWKDEVQHATCIAIWDQGQWAYEALHLQATFASLVAAPCLLHIWASPLLPVSLPPALTRTQGKHETHTYEVPNSSKTLLLETLQLKILFFPFSCQTPSSLAKRKKERTKKHITAKKGKETLRRLPGNANPVVLVYA
jgi:hypothetical protein